MTNYINLVMAIERAIARLDEDIKTYKTYDEDCEASISRFESDKRCMRDVIEQLHRLEGLEK